MSVGKLIETVVHESFKHAGENIFIVQLLSESCEAIVNIRNVVLQGVIINHKQFRLFRHGYILNTKKS